MIVQIIQTVVLIVFWLILAFVGYKIIERRIEATIEDFIEVFTGTFEKAPVKRAMSILGSKSGESKREKAVIDRIAQGALSSPQLNALKMGAKAMLNVDVDEIIEEFGPMATLSGLTQIAQALGHDPKALIGQGLNITTGRSNTSGDKEYLQG